MNKDIMRAAGWGKQVKLIEEKKCPFCKNFIDVKSFKNEINKKEYKISGLCQKCQDGFFR